MNVCVCARARLFPFHIPRTIHLIHFILGVCITGHQRKCRVHVFGHTTLSILINLKKKQSTPHCAAAWGRGLRTDASMSSTASIYVSVQF